MVPESMYFQVPAQDPAMLPVRLSVRTAEIYVLGLSELVSLQDRCSQPASFRRQGSHCPEYAWAAVWRKRAVETRSDVLTIPTGGCGDWPRSHPPSLWKERERSDSLVPGGNKP